MLPPRYESITASTIDGGFGSVRKVYDTYLDRTVLFKSMQNEEDNDQLLNEIQALAKARSRHVVEIYDVITASDKTTTGIIIELLEGREYSQFHSEALDHPDTYIRVLYQIATALADLHRCGIVHRDLKLDNLRDSTSGILKIFDFGISSLNTGYHTKNNRGTFVYAAPELYVKGARITAEMDIYAFGVCAWALASEEFPDALLERPPQQKFHLPSIRTVKADWLPQTVCQVIDRALDPDPALRPKAEEISRILGRYLVRGQHKGLFVQGKNELYELSSATPSVKIRIGAIGELWVDYNGLDFNVVAVSGDVAVNNRAVSVGMQLHEACVLTFGSFSAGSGRQFVTFFASHPEVIL